MKKPSEKCYSLIVSFEGYSPDAYVDPGTGGEPITIGYGTTVYPNGHKVKMGDICTVDEAEVYLEHEIEEKTKGLYQLLDTGTLNQNQFDALVSFAYNCGLGNFKKSTLLKKVKVDPNDPTIPNEFMKWVNAGGKPMKGLIRRRAAEAELYKKIK